MFAEWIVWQKQEYSFYSLFCNKFRLLSDRFKWLLVSSWKCREQVYSNQDWVRISYECDVGLNFVQLELPHQVYLYLSSSRKQTVLGQLHTNERICIGKHKKQADCSWKLDIWEHEKIASFIKKDIYYYFPSSYCGFSALYK